MSEAWTAQVDATRGPPRRGGALPLPEASAAWWSASPASWWRGPGGAVAEVSEAPEGSRGALLGWLPPFFPSRFATRASRTGRRGTASCSGPVYHARPEPGRCAWRRRAPAEGSGSHRSRGRRVLRSGLTGWRCAAAVPVTVVRTFRLCALGATCGVRRRRKLGLAASASTSEFTWVSPDGRMTRSTRHHRRAARSQKEATLDFAAQKSDRGRPPVGACRRKCIRSRSERPRGSDRAPKAGALSAADAQRRPWELRRSPRPGRSRRDDAMGKRSPETHGPTSDGRACTGRSGRTSR